MWSSWNIQLPVRIWGERTSLFKLLPSLWTQMFLSQQELYFQNIYTALHKKTPWSSMNSKNLEVDEYNIAHPARVHSICVM